MGEERKDPILWGTEFQRWKHTYGTLEASLNAMEGSTGPVSSTFLSGTQGAERHPYLLEVKLRVMELYMRAAEDPRLEMVQRKRAEFETVKGAELNGIRNISNRIYEIMNEMVKKMENPQAVEKDEVADIWDEIFEEEGVGGNIELKNLEERLHEECAKLRKFLSNRSGEVRLAAAEAFAHAKDTGSLVDYAYAEVFPENRRKILEEILVAVRLGAEPGMHEGSMLLKMTEDIDPECAEKAWAIAFRLFNRNLLSQEQLEYLLNKETVADGEEKADLSRRAHLWMRMSCSREVDEKERASLLSRVEEAIWMGARLGEAEVKMFARLVEKAQGEAARQAWSLVMELLGKDALGKEEIAELLRASENIADGRERKRVQARLGERMPAEGKKAEPAGKAEEAAQPVAEGTVLEIDDSIWSPEQKAEEPAAEQAARPAVIEIDDSNGADEAEKPAEVRVIVMDDEDIPIDPLSQAMGQLERGELGDGQVAELVLLADAVEDKDERKRAFDKIVKVLGPGKQLRGEGADEILNAERMSRVFLDTVKDERPSGVAMRKSQPPGANGKRDSVPPAEKVPAKA
ncbi:MAG: hypothetical protein NTY83_03495 [Candidatus Micrarchaeota archaeon]|nr:hypothetical protein [Candidatus Micrarchaeota archaeon]